MLLASWACRAGAPAPVETPQAAPVVGGPAAPGPRVHEPQPGGGGAGAAAALERVERRVASMGTLLSLEVEAPTRRTALLASEAAVRALEAAEARLSTWRLDSELSRLNRAAVGEAFELSLQLAADLEAAFAGREATRGGFDPAVGRLVELWGLRTGGRLPASEDVAAAIVPGGLLALRIEGRVARRLHRGLVLEEGGFGKGRGLDEALGELARAGALRAQLDLGGQVAVLESERPYRVGVRHPGSGERSGLELELRHGSLSTTGNAERAVEVAGRRIAHVLDPRTGHPARDFGSLTVWAADATWADMLSTGLYVLGPDEALSFAARHEGIGVLVLEHAADGRDGLRARCDATFEALVVGTVPELPLEVLDPEGPRAARPSAPRSALRTHLLEHDPL